MKFTNHSKALMCLLAISQTSPVAFATPTLTKLHDFNNAVPFIGVQNPYDTPVLVGSELWFTSQNGGTTGFGTLASFDLMTNLPTIRVSLDNASGNTPNGNPILSDGFLYYTTTRGGTGDRGTINSRNRDRHDSALPIEQSNRHPDPCIRRSS